MTRHNGMTLLEVMVALMVFALVGLTLLQTTAQQAGALGHMEEKMLANWLADNQQAQLHLEQWWPEKHWTGKEVQFAGRTWSVRWQGVDTMDSRLRALDVEVRRQENDPAPLITLRSYVVRP
ncbi:type II secretion system minor pseudopilin GspI [Zobellella sp. DQSA1]|uniref:type II secretion system minor pseudopilin GspI n=1 Tax=Zobellella sp. DQSA1 TaxID=3342386 RepID=UPI0035BFE68C